MAEGLKGFSNLHLVVNSLQNSGLSSELSREYKAEINRAKLYLKGQYSIDIAPSHSSCADHCRKFALSDPNPKKTEFRQQCDHEHDDICEPCEKLKSLFVDLEREATSLLDESSKDELLYDLNVAKEQIEEWKKHILRAAQLQLGKEEILKSLSFEKGLLIVDWRMICLPQAYLETTKNWYGKKGMSWSFACLI